MKKILSFVLASLAVPLSFMGCGLHDMAAPDALYIVGDMAGAHTAMEKNGSSFTYTMTYSNGMNAWGGGAGTANFKFTFTPDWNSPTSLGNDVEDVPVIAATEDEAEVFGLTESGNPANVTVAGFVDGEQYTFTVTVDATGTYTLTIVGTIDEGLFEFADVSAVDASTVIQEGAYIKLEGSSCELFNGVKIYFNGTTTGVAYVEADKAYDCTGWGGTNFAAWFKFYAGQGVSLRQKSAQFKCPAPVNLGEEASIGTEGDNFVVSDLTAVAMGDIFKVTVDASADATIKLEKL